MIKQLSIFIIGIFFAIISFITASAPSFFGMGGMLPCAESTDSKSKILIIGLLLFSILIINLLYFKIGKFKDKNIRRYISITFGQFLIFIILSIILYFWVKEYIFLHYSKECAQFYLLNK